jgi:hypothetical protein
MVHNYYNFKLWYKVYVDDNVWHVYFVSSVLLSVLPYSGINHEEQQSPISQKGWHTIKKKKHY